MTTTVSPDRPLFFEPNRVWRCYTGGLLLDRLRDVARPEDGNFPEDWLASTTRAANGPRQSHPDEGLSKVRLPGGDGPLLAGLLAADPAAWLGADAPDEEGVGVLCKFLDSAVRLPIQCHPDRAFAREHFRSEHGKTESWIILGTREVNGEEPYLLMGFRPDATREAFIRAVKEQDMAAAVSMLHAFPARPGDAWIIPGRLPHAIGPGVFMLEVQEPTDWVVQPEERIGETELSRTDMWGPLTPEVGMECFDYDGAAGKAETEARLALAPTTLRDESGGRVASLIGPETTDCFRVDRLTVDGEFVDAPESSFHIAVAAEGEGVVSGAWGEDRIRAGDVFFAPCGVGEIRYRAGDPLTVYRISR